MENIKNKLINAPVVHFDETGVRVNGKNRWLHSAGNEKYTYLQTHVKRGKIATKEIGILPNFRGVAVHDFWKSYFAYCLCVHALCNAHIIRELVGITENFNQEWAEKMKTLLYEIKDKLEASNGLLTLSEIEIFDKLYDDILYIAVMENPSPVIDIAIIDKKRGRKANSKPRNLVNRLIDYKESILRFMIDPSVPFTNNSAERDLRMSKVFQKISGGFRSDQGVVSFDVIRSYISTGNKQNISMFQGLFAAFSKSPLFTE